MAKVNIFVDSADEAGIAEVSVNVDALIAQYGTYILANVNTGQIDTINAAGFRVEMVDDEDILYLNSVTIDTNLPAPVSPAQWSYSGESTYWFVQFTGSPLQNWLTEVSDTGVEIVDIVTSNTVLVKMNSAQALTVGAFDFITWSGQFEPLYKIEPALAGENLPVPASEFSRLTKADGVDNGNSNELISLEIETHVGEDLLEILSVISGAEGTVDKQGENVVICSVEHAAIRDLANLQQVSQINQYFPDEPEMQRARVLTGVQDVFDVHGLTGEGEVTALADTGISSGFDNETMHTDFKKNDGVTTGRIKQGYDLGGKKIGRESGWEDTKGHGTHVAGIIAGTGRSLAGTPQSGVAIKAELVIQSLQDAAGLFVGIPANLNSLFSQAYDNDDVRVHNNSWGSPIAVGTTTSYNAKARQIDEFVWRNPDMVIVFSAGNSGSDGTPAPGAPNGIVDFGSVGRTKTFRNGITVGACENNRPEITSTNVGVPTWGNYWPSDYPNAPLNNDLIADNAAQIAAFSSRGPTSVASGGRVKPDIVAPGSSIFSVYSSLSASSDTWGNRPAGSPYIYKGGTSMAAPHVSGLCTLIRQYLRDVHDISDPLNPDRRQRRPSAALIKALLIHGAQPLPITNNTGTTPGNHQGWGRANLRRTLFSNPPLSLVTAADNGWLPRRTLFIDDPAFKLNAAASPAPLIGRQRDFKIKIANTSVPLRATLTWTDYPGSSAHAGTVLNELELRIVRVRDNFEHNIAAPAGLLPAPAIALTSAQIARRNNVQQIDISTAGAASLEAGEYIIRVLANRIPSMALAQEEQDFALVISGAISESDHSNPGTMIELPDLAFIDLHDAPDGRHLHDGLVPSPEKPQNNLGSPDIWISQTDDVSSAIATNKIETGEDYFIFVKIHNLGFADANGSQINIYWADPTTPMSFPGDWETDGFEISEIPTNQVNLDVAARSSVTVGPFKWTAPENREYIVLFVRAEHVNDPIKNSENLRLDNNITRRDVYIQDNSIEVQGEPNGWQKFWFMVFSFSTPRNIETRLLIYYEDVRDGEIKPVPAGIEIEIWDEDTVWDDKVAQGTTVTTTDTAGKAASAMHLTFSTYESGEGSPDLYCKILMPEGETYREFITNSYFANGAPYWHSKTEPVETGGFYKDDFDGNRLGIPLPEIIVMRPRGIRVHALLEYIDVISGEFKSFPAGVMVKIRDSKMSAPQPLLARATSDENGKIGAVLQKREDYQPSVYFEIEDSDDSAVSVGYFIDNDSWSSLSRQVDIVALDGSVTTRSGHFENVSGNNLVAENELLRFRISTPRIQLHLRFEYFNRELASFVPLPAGIKLEVWSDEDSASLPIITARTGDNGQAELSVPKGTAENLDLFVRVVMNLEFETESLVKNEVGIFSAAAVIHWDTKGNIATDASDGLFNNVENEVASAASPLTFRIGTGAADAESKHAAPFILNVIGEVYGWLHQRLGQSFNGAIWTEVHLLSNAAEGSNFDNTQILETKINLNTMHIAGNLSQLDTANVQPDHWNRLIIAHQYAHLIYELLFLDFNRVAVSVINHKNFNVQNNLNRNVTGRRRALAEGFAEFIAYRHLIQNQGLKSDVSAGGWAASGGAKLFSVLGGKHADDNTFISCSVNPVTDKFEILLNELDDPRTSVSYIQFRASGYVVRIRYRSRAVSQNVNLTVKVMEAAKEIASWSFRSTSAEWVTSVLSLSSTQIDSIAKNITKVNNNISIRIIADGGTGSNRQVDISWLEFEMPHTARPDRSANQMGWRGTDNDGSNSSGETSPMAIANMLWHLDNSIVGYEHAGIEEDINQRRFNALIIQPLKSLQDNDKQTAFHLYRAIQSAVLDNDDYIDSQVLKTRQEVRHVFEANGMVFTRGVSSAAVQTPAAPAVPVIWVFNLQPALEAVLNVFEKGNIKAYRIDAAPAGTINFVELDTFTLVTTANQRLTINVNVSEARETGALTVAGAYDFRVRVMDEFDAWDSFADDYTANNNAAIANNDDWLRKTLNTIKPAAADSAINVP